MAIETSKVVAITVTYNRTCTLEKTLVGLSNQLYPIDKIIIVDNNSNTEEKQKIRSLAEKYLNVEVLYLEENLGGAGGFEKGMTFAFEDTDADWFWIMDDDAYPRPDTLETLMRNINRSNNLGAICPTIFGIDNNEYQIYHHKIISPYIMSDNKIVEKYEDLKEAIKIEANAFVGPLIARKAIETLGVADGSLFIYGDDTEYTYRVSRKFDVLLIKDAVIDHQDPPVTKTGFDPKSWWKEYYSLRNRVFFINKFGENRCKKLVGKLYVSYTVFRRCIAATLKPKYKGYRVFRIKLLVRAIVDGFLNKRGKRVDPGQYMNDINQIENRIRNAYKN